MLVVSILFQALVWERFRIPFGATLVILTLLFSECIYLYLSSVSEWHHINYIRPTLMTPVAIWFDVVLLLTDSYILTAFIGPCGFALLFFPTNYPMYAPLNMAVEYSGVVMSLADIQGYQYLKTGTSEYTRMASTTRVFGTEAVPVSVFFSGFACMSIYVLWYFLKRWLLRPWGLSSKREL